MPYIPNSVTWNAATDDKPTGYLSSLRDYYGPGSIEVSQLFRMNAWEVLKPGTWYACIRAPGSTAPSALYVFASNDQVAGVIKNPEATLCAGSQYTPLPDAPA